MRRARLKCTFRQLGTKAMASCVAYDVCLYVKEPFGTQMENV